MSNNQKNTVHRSHDKTFIEVVDKGDFRFLLFKDEIVQSKVFKAEPYRLMLRYTQYMMGTALLTIPHPERILLIGVGAGTLLHFFSHFLPHARVDAVDNSEQILHVARTYFSVPESEKIALHCNDGLLFLTDDAAEKTYDLILIDAFNDSGMAKSIYSAEFMHQACRHLTPRGVIIGNLWSGNQKAFERVRKAIKQYGVATLFVPVRTRENVIGMLLQQEVPWQRFCPSRDTLKELSAQYRIDFGEVAATTRKHNMKFSDRLSLLGNNT